MMERSMSGSPHRVIRSPPSPSILRWSGRFRFLDDGRSVMSASLDGSVRVWELETGREIEDPRLAPPHSGKGISVQKISPTLSEVATGFFDGSIFLWSLETGERRDFPKGSDPIKGVIFSHDETCVFVVEGEQWVRVFDRVSRAKWPCLTRLTPPGRTWF